MKEIRFPLYLPADNDGFQRVVDLPEVVASQVEILMLEEANKIVVDGIYLGPAAHYPDSSEGTAVMLYVFLVGKQIKSVVRCADLDRLMKDIDPGSICNIYVKPKNRQHANTFGLWWRDLGLTCKAGALETKSMEGSDDAPD